jgi:hypothetical protein
LAGQELLKKIKEEGEASAALVAVRIFESDRGWSHLIE